MRHLLDETGAWIMNVWFFSYLLADTRDGWRKESPAAKLNHWICYPALLGWLVNYAVNPPVWWLAWLVLLWPVLWWYVHKHHHNHKRTKRLLEAGRGLVQRFHNRLVVVPEPAD